MLKYSLIVLLSSVVLVENSNAQQQPQQPKLPDEIVLKVSPTELDTISDGLQTQPFGKVFPLINKLRQQVVDQQPKVEEQK